MGDFSCLALEDLQRMNRRNSQSYQKSTDNLITYSSMIGNILELINDKYDRFTVFQAASQLNLLEMINDEITPEMGILNYHNDRTQGPMVALSSPIGTAFRNYLVFNGKPQTRDNQINTLKELLDMLKIRQVYNSPSEGQYLYSNGYAYIYLRKYDSEINQNLFDQYLKVGVQWNSPLLVDNTKTVCQVYCSALPMGDNYLSKYGLNNDAYKKQLEPF